MTSESPARVRMLSSLKRELAQIATAITRAGGVFMRKLFRLRQWVINASIEDDFRVYSFLMLGWGMLAWYFQV